MSSPNTDGAIGLLVAIGTTTVICLSLFNYLDAVQEKREIEIEYRGYQRGVEATN